MRDLINILESISKQDLKPLTEAKGLFGRNPGDPFVHQDGREYQFVDIMTFPQEAEYEQYETSDDRDEEIAQFQEEHAGSEIIWTNKPGKNMLAFAVAQLDDADGNAVYWGRYFQRVKPNMMGTWDNKQIPPGWALKTSGAEKFATGFDPQHLIKTEKEFKNVSSIIKTVEENASGPAKDVFTEALRKLAQGDDDVVFSDMYGEAPAIRDYFGEIMQPVALIGGVIKGQAEDAREDLADGASWEDCEVMWPMSMNAALCDSFMLAPNGQKIGISSKGGKGAAASAKNLHDAIEKAEKERKTSLLKNAEYTVKIIKIIENNSMIDGPIELGKELGIPGVDDDLHNEIKKYIQSGKSDYQRISKNAKNLIAPYSMKVGAPGFNTGNAILSSVAKECAKVVNETDEFSDGALSLLNQSSIIQIYTSLGKRGDDAVLRNFNAVYPPVFNGKVTLDGSKNYTSTRIIGKFAFKIGKDVRPDLEPTISVDQDEFKKTAAAIAKGGTTKTEPTKARKVGDVGRKKR